MRACWTASKSSCWFNWRSIDRNTVRNSLLARSPATGWRRFPRFSRRKSTGLTANPVTKNGGQPAPVAPREPNPRARSRERRSGRVVDAHAPTIGWYPRQNRDLFLTRRLATCTSQELTRSSGCPGPGGQTPEPAGGLNGVESTMVTRAGRRKLANSLAPRANKGTCHGKSLNPSLARRAECALGKCRCPTNGPVDATLSLESTKPNRWFNRFSWQNRNFFHSCPGSASDRLASTCPACDNPNFVRF